MSLARPMSLHRRLARKLPRPVRRAFVRAADARQPLAGGHHLGHAAITAQTSKTAAGAVTETGKF